MQVDAEKDPIVFPDAVHARRLLNQVDRKLVKQTVMTSVYGVTYIGARDQIKKRLKECALFSDDAELYGAACYTARITLTALGKMFQAARDIMSWLGECAKVASSQLQIRGDPIIIRMPAPKRGEIVRQIGDALRAKLQHLG